MEKTFELAIDEQLSLDDAPRVEDLSRQDKKIDSSYISSLCDIIKQGKSLTAVTVSDNKIGVVGATAIAEAIAQSKSLTNVNLGYNDIGDIGVAAIAEAIKQSQSLTDVDLSCNCIQEEGAAAIAEAIKQSTSLTSVKLGGKFNWCCRCCFYRRGHQRKHFVNHCGFGQ